MSRDRLFHPCLGAVLAGLLCLGAAGAHAAPRLQIAKSETGAKILVYDSLCDEDNALECMIAEIGCDAPGEFIATVFALNAKEAANVFAKGNGRGSVAAGANGRALQVSKLALSQFTYKWDASLISFERPNEAWALVWNSAEIQLQVGGKKVVLRRSDINEVALREVVSLCAAPVR